MSLTDAQTTALYNMKKYIDDRKRYKSFEYYLLKTVIEPRNDFLVKLGLETISLDDVIKDEEHNRQKFDDAVNHNIVETTAHMKTVNVLVAQEYIEVIDLECYPYKVKLLK